MTKEQLQSVTFESLMKKLFTLLMLAVLTLQVQAQNTLKEKLFLGFVSSYYLDFVTSPLSTVDVSYQGSIDTAAPFQTQYVSFISLGIEPRLNLKEFSEDVAIAIAMPITIGFGQAVPENADMVGASGYGNIQIPLLAKIYLGNSSTYNSEKEFGFSAGAGFEFNRLALISRDEDVRLKEANKGWIMPVFSGSVHFWRGSSPMEINFKYGRGALSSYDTNRWGQNLQDGERLTRASSIKVSLVYLFDV